MKMEDSGFDSGDVRAQDAGEMTPIEVHVITASSRQPLMESSDDRRPVEMNGRTTRNSSAAQLQRRIERRIEQARKSHVANGTIDQQPKKNLISISRLQVPGKATGQISDGAERPLVSWETDSSEDEYEINPSTSTSKFLKHSQDFDLDLIPDEEELDLIPPQPLNQRCACCMMSRNICAVQ